VLPTITIDIGTTSVKLCLFDADAALIASARTSTPTISDDAGEIYDLESLRGSILSFIEELAAEDRDSVQRIALTGVGESGGLVMGDLSLASPMIVWHDQRGAHLLEVLTPSERRRIYEITGLPVNGNYALSKAAWAVRRAGDDAAGAQWLNIAEYLAATMSGQRWSEPSLASRTMALDLSRAEWSAEVCGFMGLDVSVFPDLRPAVQGTSITPAFAQEARLSKGVRVHVAGHDHMVGAVGAGLQPGELLNSTGTTEGLLFLRDAPSVGEDAELSKLANGLACEGDGYTLFASIPTGGSAFATLQHILGINAAELAISIEDVYSRYVAGELDPASAPLILPQFRGSPPPTKNSAARGIIAGLRTDTTMEEIVFGCFLGMTVQFRDVLDLFDTPVEKIKVIGPASSNPLWLQLKADLLGVPLSASRFPEVVSQGAQALASTRSASWTTADAFDILPDERRHRRLAAWADDVAAEWEYLKRYPT
jgi:sugar (pentulose or hexulose) kinase